MKTLVLGLAISLAGVAVAHADFTSTREAEDTVRAYNDLAAIAIKAGDEKYPRKMRHGSRNYHDIHEVRAYDQIADLAHGLAQEIHRHVYRPVRAGASEFRIEKQLERFEEDQKNLEAAIRKLGSSLDTDVERAARHAARQWDHLDDALENGGGWHHSRPRRPGRPVHPGPVHPPGGGHGGRPRP
jgi:hypothetical protein